MKLFRPRWKVVFDEDVHARAMARIESLYPGGTSPERMDILGWYERWILDLERDPFHVLGAPPMRTSHPRIARFPADERVPVSGIADVDRVARTITILEVHIRPPRGK
jgi:hypothetical protein